MISKEQLNQIMPKASGENLEKYCQPLNEAMAKFQINTIKRIAAFIAQLAHESGSLKYSIEGLNYSTSGLVTTWPRIFPTVEIAQKYSHNPQAIANKAYANRMGNGDEASGEGWKYRGRGPIQITGKDNYTECGQGIGADLVNHPELLEGPVCGAMSAAWFWNNRNLNQFADEDEFVKITKRINGGINGLTDREAFWARAKEVLQ